ncbi:MAG: arylesterase, partial [Verrucomicrobiales bacterium]
EEPPSKLKLTFSKTVRVPSPEGYALLTWSTWRMDIRELPLRYLALRWCMHHVCLTGALICLLSNFLFPIASADGAEKRIVVLGDSLTAGYGVSKLEAYPALLQKKIEDAGLKWKVANGGRSGDTTKSGLSRLNWLLKKPADMLIIALGGNDGLRGLSSDAMRVNLKAMIDLAREGSPDIQIVLAGMQMPDNMGPEYVKAFKAVYPDLAKEEDLSLIPFLLEGVGGSEELNQDDRIHPNEAGHKAIAETVWKVVEPLLLTPSQ